MLRVAPTPPPELSQAQDSAPKLEHFAGRNVSVATAANAENFVDGQSSRAENPMPSPRPIRTIHIRQSTGGEREHVMTDPALVSAPGGKSSLQTPEDVKTRTKQYASNSTPMAVINNFISGSHQDSTLSDQKAQMFSTLAKYNEVLDKQMVRIADLADKLNEGKASPKEVHELNALFKSHKHNLSVVQTHLAYLGSHSRLTPEARVLKDAFEIRFAERHMDLANLMSLFSDSLPEQEPISKGERIEYSLLQAKGCLRAVQTMPGLSTDARGRIAQVLTRHCHELEQHVKFQKGEHNPETDNLSLELLTEDFSLTKDGKKLSSRILAPLNAQWDQFSERRPGLKPIPLTHPKISQPKMIELFVQHQLKAAGVARRDMPSVGFLLRQGVVDEINHKEWPVVNKELQFEVAGAAHTAQSTIAPGAHLAEHFDEKYPSNGISSMDRMQYKHVPNMAHSKMTAADGETTFSGIRHGILDPYMINDKNLKSLPDAQLSAMIKDLLLDTGTVDIPSGQSAEDYASTVARQVKEGNSEIPDIANKLRTESSKMMAKELLTAAVVSDPQKMQAALDGETVGVSLNSISLVTPDALRARFKTGASGDEKTMLVRQTESLKALAASGEVSLQVRDERGDLKSIKVIPKVRTFNFGVNKGAVATTKGVLGPNTPLWGRAMGWGFAASMNNPELLDLLGNPRSQELGGAVAAKITQMAGSEDEPTRKQAVLLRQAATQVKEIWRSQSFRSGGKEPYKMVSRLALVSHLMGETALYNCKSGKDRTGQLDAEVKYLASVGKATGQVPRPEEAYTNESRRMRTNFALNTGNHEMQQMTVGLKGYKLKGVPGLSKAMEADMIDIYRGGSQFVKT